MKKIIILSLVIFLSLSLLAFADETAKNLKKKGLHVADLSQEDKINLQLNRLEQAIQHQQIEEIDRIVSENYVETELSISKSLINLSKLKTSN
jgi:hypothetical protein